MNQVEMREMQYWLSIHCYMDIIPGITAVCNGYMHILPTIRLVIYIFTSFAR